MENITAEYYAQRPGDILMVMAQRYYPYDHVLLFQNIAEIKEVYDKISIPHRLPRFMTGLDALRATIYTGGTMEDFGEYLAHTRQQSVRGMFNNSRTLGIIDHVTIEDITHIHGKHIDHTRFNIYDHLRDSIPGIIITGTYDRHADHEAFIDSQYINGPQTPLQLLFHAQPQLFRVGNRSYCGEPTLRIKHLELIEELADIAE